MRDLLNMLTKAATIATGGQALTSAAISENDVNLGAASKQPGLGGRPLYLHILVSAAAAAGDAAKTAVFALVDDTVTLVSAAATQRILLATKSLTGAVLTVGKHIVFPIPPGVLQKFVGWQFTPSASFGSGLKVISWVDDVAPNDLTVVT